MGGSRPLSRMPRGPRCWCPSPSSAQLPRGGGGLGCHDLVDGICRPAAGLAAASHRDRAGGGRGRCVRRFDAVRGVTFSVRRGELFALLGTNGAGKTSTMEVLEGLVPPAQGTVRVLGRDPFRERALVRRRMGIMLQEGGFPPDLTVAETGRMWAGTLSAPRPVAEALELVSLGDRSGAAVRSLSGGEPRSPDLATATLGRPAALFLDDPSTGLDPPSCRRTWLLIRELLAAG